MTNTMSGRARGLLAAAGTTTAVTLLATLTPSAANASDTEVTAAINAVYAAAYLTAEEAEMGFTSTAREYDIDGNGKSTLTARTRAWVNDTSFGERGATVEEHTINPRGRTETLRYGSWQSLNTGDFTAWYALPRAAETSRANRTVINQLPTGTRYVKGTPGNDYDKYMPVNVTSNLEDDQLVPWAVDASLIPCRAENPVVPVDCTVTGTTTGKERTWDFTITRTPTNQPGETIHVRIKTNSDGYITYQSVTEEDATRYGDLQIVTQADLSTNVDVPRPTLAKASIASADFIRIAALSDAKALARNFRVKITDTLRKAGKPANVTNVQWAVLELAETSPGWWDVPDNNWIGLRGNSIGPDLISAYSRASDGLTGTRATISFTVRNGRLVAGTPILS